MLARINTGAALVLTCGVLALPSFAGDFERLAAQISRAAKVHHRQRIAVLPFQTIGGKGSTSGRIVSERLLGPLMSDGVVDVIERTLLETVMREQQLQFSGLVDARLVKELGKVLGVDALVMGTVIALKDDRVEINARLIDSETARVLFASGSKIDKDWNESLFDDAAWNAMALPAFSPMSLAANSSGGGDWVCERAQERGDEIELSLLDLKARFWAQKLREGLSGASLKRNPGSEIQNPNLRAQFYDRLRMQSAAVGPDLNETEMDSLKSGLERLARLNRSCGGEGS